MGAIWIQEVLSKQKRVFGEGAGSDVRMCATAVISVRLAEESACAYSVPSGAKEELSMGHLLGREVLLVGCRRGFRDGLTPVANDGKPSGP